MLALPGMRRRTHRSSILRFTAYRQIKAGGKASRLTPIQFCCEQ
jgi:hypothetical protein